MSIVERLTENITLAVMEVIDQALAEKDEEIKQLKKEYMILDDDCMFQQGVLREQCERYRMALEQCRKWFESMIDTLEQMGVSMEWAREVYKSILATEALAEGKGEKDERD